MPFEFSTAARIVFGAGTVREVAPAASSLGRRALLVTGQMPRLTLPDAVPFIVSGEPVLDVVRAGVAAARAGRCDVVVACGGGSVLDAGKAIAAMLTNDGDLLDYLEVVGKGLPLPRAAAPCVAVPTTAGTGSEVTRNAVLGSPRHRVKASLRSASMLPRVAVVDPELTLDLPRRLTASTGLDALTQLIEPYVSSRANELTDLYCVPGIQRVARSLRLAWADGANLEARTDMALASLLGGMSLANAGLGAVHGFAAPIGGMFEAPHGAVCAAVLPHATAVNVRALRGRAPGSPALARYQQVARLLTGHAHAQAEDCEPFLRELVASLEIPGLGAYGVRAEDAGPICQKAACASSMKANPIVLSPEELREIFAGAIESD